MLREQPKAAPTQWLDVSELSRLNAARNAHTCYNIPILQWQQISQHKVFLMVHNYFSVGSWTPLKISHLEAKVQFLFSSDKVLNDFTRDLVLHTAQILQQAGWCWSLFHLPVGLCSLTQLYWCLHNPYKVQMKNLRYDKDPVLA